MQHATILKLTKLIYEFFNATNNQKSIHEESRKIHIYIRASGFQHLFSAIVRLKY